jgi:hypothetical protein
LGKSIVASSGVGAAFHGVPAAQLERQSRETMPSQELLAYRFLLALAGFGGTLSANSIEIQFLSSRGSMSAGMASKLGSGAVRLPATLSFASRAPQISQTRRVGCCQLRPESLVALAFAAASSFESMNRYGRNRGSKNEGKLSPSRRFNSLNAASTSSAKPPG